MLFNHLRVQVHDYRNGDPSLCSLCGGALIARRGEIVIWHWAHRARSASRKGCPHQESTWHIKWKLAYLSFKQWTVEHTLTVGDKRYVVDAMNMNTGLIREFVHSLSPYYLAKHHDLATKARYDVRWVVDGHAFLSKRHQALRSDGIKNMLTPRARLFCERVGNAARVHYAGQLWKFWKSDIWYPDSGGAAVLEAFVDVDRKKSNAAAVRVNKPRTRAFLHEDNSDQEIE